MKLYRDEGFDIIFATQIQDPFFSWVMRRFFTYVTKPHARIIDLGCGSGRNVIEAARRGHTAVGVDSNPRSIRIARTYAKKERVTKLTEFHVGDILKIKKSAYGTFDCVILQEVIEHVGEYRKLIKMAYGLLKKDGILLLSTPNDPKQWNILDVYAEHVRRFTIPEVRKALSDFRCIEITTHGFPFHRLSIFLYTQLMRHMHRNHQAKYFRHNRMIHRMFYAVGTVVMMIDGLFRTPYGTTIIAVARK
jgi:2-polyprenyl-3-methyl-5-hydroxy-6-metoxy-1,4-benzoquinol methylase